MKIVYLFNSSLPSYNASSLQVVNVCYQIAKKIGTLTLITPNTGLSKTIFDHYGLRKNFEIIKIKSFNKFPIGLKFYLYSFMSVIYGLKINPKIFVTRNYFTLFLLILLRREVIFEVHTSLDMEGRVVNFLYNNLNIFNSKKIINLIFITNSVKNHFFKKYNIKSRKFCILPSASNFKSTFPKIRNNKNLKIGYFGLVNKSRGFNFICNLSKIDTDNDYFIIGGSNNQINDFKRKNLNKNLHLKSYIPHKKIKNYIMKMDLLILPYENKVLVSGNVGDIGKFTSPMKLFDYLASSKPIIASSLPVLKEILSHKQNCIFINNLNIYKWKLEINKLKNLPKIMQIISKNNFNLSKNFTYELRVKRMFNI